MQGTWVQSLLQEDPTCRGATKPVIVHNNRAGALEPGSHNYQVCNTVLETVFHNRGSHHNERTTFVQLESSPRLP